jgi:hypothetical protein
MDLFDTAMIFLGVLVVLGAIGFEYRMRQMRSKVVQNASGLLFESHQFSLQVQRAKKQIHVESPRGFLTVGISDTPATLSQASRVQRTFEAIGFRTDIKPSTPMETTIFDIEMTGGDGAALKVCKVPQPVVANFEVFARQIHLWIDKLERRAERDRIERLRIEQETAQAERHAEMMAQLLPNGAPKEPLSAEAINAIANAQIASWRTSAGFEGEHSQRQIDANGRVIWFVDLCGDGRITLHAEHRTIHTSLRGAVVNSLAAELEVGVRDQYWSEDNPELRPFKILRGLTSDERRAWKERLEITRDKANGTPA